MTAGLIFTSVLLFLIVLMFTVHQLHIRFHRGLSAGFIILLWFISFLTGHLDLSYILPYADLKFRYSTTVYMFIFASILLTYTVEGTRQARNLILISIATQMLILIMQLLISNSSAGPAELSQLYQKIFAPSPVRFSGSLIAAVLALLWAVISFQWLVNNLPKQNIPLSITGALWSAFLIDSVIFLLISRPHKFTSSLPEHLVLKTAFTVILALPLAFYIMRIRKSAHLTLDRGSFDIFRKVHDLEHDLEKANAELRDYADHLEDKVEARTREIQEKQRLIDQELDMAAGVQQTLLSNPVDIEPLKPAIRYLPASSVSGDLYRFGTLKNNEIYLFLADISGHGAASAMVATVCYMAMTRMNLNALKPSQILANLSKEVSRLESSYYLTAVFFKINLKKRKLTYANGAHVSPVLISKKNKLHECEPTGSILGMSSVTGDEFSDVSIRYKENSRLLLFTDCLSEHPDPESGEEFGEERLYSLLLDNRGHKPEKVADTLIDRVHSFGRKRKFKDDLTLVLTDLP